MSGIDWLGWIGTLCGVLYLAWKYIIKIIFEKWLDYRLELSKQEVGHALAIQKDLALKKAEFEAVKLSRVLPLLESINKCLNEHSMMFGTYIGVVLSRGGLSEDFEDLRLAQDEKLVGLIPEICIYLPKEFRDLLYGMRRVVSCSWHKARAVSEVLYEIGDYKAVANAAQEIHISMIDCFYAMTNKYVGVVDDDREYADILMAYGFDVKVSIIDRHPIRLVAWRYILLHEYSGGKKIGEALEALKNYYNKQNSSNEER
jgi:hypothetical protein